MRTFKLVLTAIAITWLAGCASDGERPSLEQRLAEMGYEQGEGNARIPSYRVNGWTSVDDRNLIITAGVNDKYLVKLFTPCFNLPSAFYIGFTTPTGRLDRFESIIVRSPGIGREVCRIEDIVRLYPVGD
ncbi:MAG: hypothetical protein RLZZ385_2131 [Pseudomonadota bacterium]|jgi:hypothetical protein